MTAPQTMSNRNHAPVPRRARGLGIGVRLLLAQALVLVAGSATSWVVAALVGPTLFREHLRRAGVPAMSDEQFHAEQAYRSATVISLIVATAAAAFCALAVTWYLSRRLQRSLATVSAAAADVSAGDYNARVSPPHLGDDFEMLATAFNEMAARLESVESTRRRLLADLAHEIRTPISVLNAFMEAFEDGVATLDDDTITMLRDQTHRLTRFSRDVTALSDAESASASIEPTWIEPGTLVAAAVTAAAKQYRAGGITLTTDLPPDLPLLWVDPERLGQVLGNLLDNALRHTPSGGHVEITVRRQRDELTITVADDGDGISAEHLPHLFERFYRVDEARDRAHGGSGIGLAIAKALTDAHGGHIRVRSDGPGAGTTVVVALPIRPNSRAPAESRTLPGSSRSGHNS